MIYYMMMDKKTMVHTLMFMIMVYTLLPEWSSWCFLYKAPHIESSQLLEPLSTGSLKSLFTYFLDRWSTYKRYRRCQSVLPLWKRDEENPSLPNILVSIEQICMWITMFYQSVLSLWKRFFRDKKTIFWSLGGWQKMFTPDINLRNCGKTHWYVKLFIAWEKKIINMLCISLSERFLHLI